MYSYKPVSQTADKSATISSTSANAKLPIFDPEDYYYETGTQLKIDDKSVPGIKLKYTGSELAIKYYRAKYKTEITLPDHRQIYALNVLVWGNKSVILRRLNNLLKEARQNTNSEHRQAFLIGSHSSHSVPVVYLRENNREALLIADSYYAQNSLAAKLALNLKLDILLVPPGRQKDTYSCHTECLIFARDITRRKPDNHYYIEKLLTKLKSRSTQLSDHCFQVRLPDELLKTAQTKTFIYSHKEADNRIIHTRSLDQKKIPETLYEFRARYTDVNATHLNTSGADVTAAETAAYLRMKAFKIANIIQIQFYIDELEILLGALWTSVWRDEFIKESKKTLHAQGLATKKREGLHALASAYIDKIKNHQTITVEKPKINLNNFFGKEKLSDSKAMLSEVRKECVIQ
jgi:hypothetical protein